MLCFENIGTNSIKEIKEIEEKKQMFYLNILHKGADAMEEAHREIPKLNSLYLYFLDVVRDFLSSLTQVTSCVLASLFCLSGHSTPSQ